MAQYRIKSRMINTDLVYDVEKRSWSTLYMWCDCYTTGSLSGARFYLKRLIADEKFIPEIYYLNKDGGLDDQEPIEHNLVRNILELESKIDSQIWKKEPLDQEPWNVDIDEYGDDARARLTQQEPLNEELGVESYFSYEDPRYPILVLRSEQFGSVGYNLDLSNGELSRVCLCYAYSENECMCGAWSLDE